MHIDFLPEFLIGNITVADCAITPCVRADSAVNLLIDSGHRKAFPKGIPISRKDPFEKAAYNKDGCRRERTALIFTQPKFNWRSITNNRFWPITAKALTPHANVIRFNAAANCSTVRSALCSFSSPNKPTRKVMKSAGSSHCSGTPAAVCKPSTKNFLPV